MSQCWLLSETLITDLHLELQPLTTVGATVLGSFVCKRRWLLGIINKPCITRLAQLEKKKNGKQAEGGRSCVYREDMDHGFVITELLLSAHQEKHH